MASLAQARYGSVRLWLADWDSDAGRTQVVQQAASGDVHDVQDRGRVLHRTQCQIVFCLVPGEDDYLDRYREFQALVDGGKPQVFTHPLHGSYLARVGDCRVLGGSDSDEIRVSAEFYRAGELDDLRGSLEPVGGALRVAGPESVAVRAAEATAELAPLGGSTAPAAAKTVAEGWAAEENLDTRRVLVEAQSTIAAIDLEIERLRLLSDLARWPAYRAMIRLRDQVVECADSFTSASAELFDLVVQVATPLRALVAKVYPAREAEERARQARDLNPSLRAPGMVPAGTVLKLPVPGGRR